MLDLEFEGTAVNAIEAVLNGSIEITTTSNDVVMPQGLYLAPMGAGTATVTVTVNTDDGTVTDSVELSVEAALVEPDPVVSTVAEQNATEFDPNVVPQQIYTITGKVSGWRSGNDGGDYGNFYLQDLENPEEEILVYGATSTEGTLTFGDNGKWTFSNPKDWKTNDATKDLTIGDEVTIKCYVSAYNGVNQLIGELVL